MTGLLGEARLVETIETQRAVRRLLPDPIDLALVVEAIRLATHAPSGSNAQGWEWIVVTDPETKGQIAELNREVADVYVAKAGVSQPLRASVSALAETMHEVPAIVVPSYRRQPAAAIDHRSQVGFYGSIFPAVQNFLLALHALGLGATMTTMALRRPGALATLLGLPVDVLPCAVIPVGRPVDPTVRSKRLRPVAEVCHLDRYGTPLERG